MENIGEGHIQKHNNNNGESRVAQRVRSDTSQIDCNQERISQGKDANASLRERLEENGQAMLHWKGQFQFLSKALQTPEQRHALL
jgi:hypothetical protein